MRLLWVSDLPSWDRLLMGRPELARTYPLATSDLALAVRWRREGLDFESPWTHATLSDQLAAAESAVLWADRWLCDVAWLSNRGVPVASLLRTSLLLLFRDALLARTLADRLLDAVDPDHIAVCGGGILEAAIAWGAHLRGVHAERINPAAAPSRGVLDPEDRWRRGISAVGTAMALNRSRRDSRANPTLLVCGGGSDYVNQLDLVRTLRERAAYRVIHVGLHAAREPSTLARMRSSPPDVVLPPYHSPLSALRSREIGRRTWRAFEARDLPGMADESALFGNPFLNSWYRELLHVALPRANGALGTARRLLSKERPAAVVVNNAASARERALLIAAREAGIPSAQIVHSGFNDLQIHQVMAGRLWVWGKAHESQFVAAGITPDRIDVVGRLGVAGAVGGMAIDSGGSTGGTRQTVRHALGVSPDQVLVLLITARPPRLLAFFDPLSHGHDLDSIVATLAQRPSVRLVVKPHPRYDDVPTYRALGEEHHWIDIIEEPVALESLIHACDLAVALNVGTTGALDAVAGGKPLLWIRCSSGYPPGFDVLAPGGLVVTERADIETALSRLVDSAESRAALTELGRRYLSDLIDSPSGGATAAVECSIDEMVARAREGVQAHGA